MKNSKYILVTAARNEEKLIGASIEALINQTLLPVKWFIVSDNSTDRTDEIVKAYADKYSFIELIKNNKQEKRDFASKVFALNKVLSIIDKLAIDYDYIGILDADITFEKDYYKTMLLEFAKDPKLGIAGGEFYDIIDNKKVRVVKSPNSVRGGIQLFRKECFDQIKRFTPLKNGGEDVITEITARKNGWKVKSFEHQMLEHHRLTGTGGWGILEAKFREGMLSYAMGYHPLFQLLKSFHRMKEHPKILSGLLHLSGFIWSNITRPKRAVSKDLMDFVRKEQLERIKKGQR